jgi:hypothetical protein
LRREELTNLQLEQTCLEHNFNKIKTMATKSKSEQLRDVVGETMGTALTLSPNDQGWTGYVLQKKKKFEAESLDGLCDVLISEFTEKRVKVENEEGKKAPKKPFKY